MGKLLTLSGYTVEVVTDSTLAVERMANFVPDAILLDLAMPQINGYDLANQIRADARFAGVSMIALSGYGDSRRMSLSLEAGFDRHLLKPVGIEPLALAIDQQVQRMRQLPVSFVASKTETLLLGQRVSNA